MNILIESRSQEFQNPVLSANLLPFCVSFSLSLSLSLHLSQYCLSLIILLSLHPHILFVTFFILISQFYLYLSLSQQESVMGETGSNPSRWLLFHVFQSCFFFSNFSSPQLRNYFIHHFIDVYLLCLLNLNSPYSYCS